MKYLVRANRGEANSYRGTKPPMYWDEQYRTWEGPCLIRESELPHILSRLKEDSMPSKDGPLTIWWYEVIPALPQRRMI